MLPTNATETMVDVAARGRSARLTLAKKYKLLGDRQQTTRSARFASRLRCDRYGNDIAEIGFTDLAALPLWSVDPATDRITLAYATGLLCFRPQLDQELDGLALRSITKTIGEDLFDRVMEAARPATSNIMLLDRPLPTPDEISHCGTALMDRAANPPQPGQTIDAPCSGVTVQEARALCDLAYRLIEHAPSSPDQEER